MTLDENLNINITDESTINLVKGCHNLKGIDLRRCPKLTDASLFSIATNCPNLESIDLDFYSDIFTMEGLMESLNKCPKLIKMASDGDDFTIPEMPQTD